MSNDGNGNGNGGNGNGNGGGPSHGNGESPAKYEVNIEGTVHLWTRPMITFEEIAQLGGWAVTDGVIVVDANNEETTLAAGAVVELKPGHSFGRKVKFKRGSAQGLERMSVELRLVQTVFPKAKLDETSTWIFIPDYPTGQGWSVELTDVAIHVTPDYFGGGMPYGFFVKSGLRFNAHMPQNFQDVAEKKPPFPGQWGFFSWTYEEGWRPHVDATKGSNLLAWALGFAKRFKEGA